MLDRVVEDARQDADRPVTTVALDPLRVMDAAHAFTSKLSTLFTGTRAHSGSTCLP